VIFPIVPPYQIQVSDFWSSVSSFRKSSPATEAFLPSGKLKSR
jgi:hypothetical protein